MPLLTPLLVLLVRAGVTRRDAHPYPAGGWPAPCLALQGVDHGQREHPQDYLFHLGTHIKVRFIPPYCYHLSPLDNGAFGLVADFLKQNAADYATQPISVGLDKAFRVYRTGSEAGALAGRICASTTVSIGFIHCEWFCDFVIEYCLYKHRSSQKHNLTLSPRVSSVQLVSAV